MALVLFNLSIDTPDSTPKGTMENLAINDQESIVELVLETFLGFEDAIDEHEDADQDENSKTSSKNIELDIYAQNSLIEANNHTGINKLIYHPYRFFQTDRFISIFSPPPEA